MISIEKHLFVTNMPYVDNYYKRSIYQCSLYQIRKWFDSVILVIFSGTTIKHYIVS